MIHRTLLILILILALAVVAAPLAAHAQQVGKVHRIGVLVLRVGLEATVHEGLRELGWLEGRNVGFERRYWKGEPETPPRRCRQPCPAQMDLIISGPGQGAVAAKRPQRRSRS